MGLYCNGTVVPDPWNEPDTPGRKDGLYDETQSLTDADVSTEANAPTSQIYETNGTVTGLMFKEYMCINKTSS